MSEPIRPADHTRRGSIIRITARGARRIRAGHPWIYRSDIVDVPSDVQSGDLRSVAGPDALILGVAAYSASSLITLRCLPITPGMEPEREWTRLVDRSIRRRAERSFELGRWVNGDADGLPGLVVDRYGPAFSVQALSPAADRRAQATIDTLIERFEPTLVVARNDSKVRAIEGLPVEKRVIHGIEPAEVEVTVGKSLRIGLDLLHGQKTGAYLDQVDNWAAAARFGHGEALDCFCYDGGFSLHLAQAGCEVTAIDSSAGAIERLTRNARRNELNVETVCANVFDQLRVYERADRQFDFIVLDPPPFAKSKAAVERSRGAYKEINLRAFKLLRPGGHLITCSCSANLRPADFEQVVAGAAVDARRWTRVLERRGAPPDHPTLLGVPETDYLKALVLEVE